MSFTYRAPILISYALHHRQISRMLTLAARLRTWMMVMMTWMNSGRRIRVIIAAASRTRVYVLPCAWHLEAHEGMVPLIASVHAHGFPTLLALMHGPSPFLLAVRAHNAATHIAFMFTRNRPQWMLLFINPKRGWQAGMSTRSADFPEITGDNRTADR